MNRDITPETSREILNDITTVYLIFSIQKKISNRLIQELYGFLGLYIYSIVLYELEKAAIINKEDLSDDFYSLLHDLRERLVHKKPIQGSKAVKYIKNDMEIDFGHYVYDNVITVEKNNKHYLYAIIFSVWDFITLSNDKIAMFNQSTLLPEELMKSILYDRFTNEEVFVWLEEKCSEIATKAEKIFHPEKYCYASGVLFKTPEPCEEDKLMIMFYYTFFKLFAIIKLFLPVESITVGDVEINIRQCLLKYKATLIELMGNDIKKKSTELIDSIKEELSNSIDQGWYKKNRALRDNIHYNKTTMFTPTELDYIENNQTQYYQIVLQAFKDRIKFSVGRKYKIIKWIASHTDTEMRKQK